MTLLDRLRSAVLEERRAAVAEMEARGSAEPGELEALVACLGDVRKAVQRPAAETCRVLATRGAPIEPLLHAALATDDDRLRFGAAYALGRLGVPPAAALPALFATLGLDDGDMRWAAAETICRTAPRAAVVTGLLALLGNGNAPQRKMALYCLRDLDARTADVEGAVVSALGDADAGVRLAAMTTVVRLARDRAPIAGRLLALLAGPDARERRAAAVALGDLGVRSAAVTTALTAAAQGDDASLRRAAERSLRLLATSA